MAVLTLVDFRKELQDAILRLQNIAKKIDEQALEESAVNEKAAQHAEAVAQARRELANEREVVVKK